MTEQEIQRIFQMRKDGYLLKEIAARLGVHMRTVQRQLRKLTVTPEQRQRQQNLRVAARRARREAAGPRPIFVASDGVGTAGNASAPKPTAEMIADRDRRISRPYSIAYDLMGDPEPGRSALDRRMSEARA